MERFFAARLFEPRRSAAEVIDFLRDARPWAYRLALAIVGSPEAAEDVAQESLVRAWRNLGTLGRASDMRAWLRRVIVRQSLTTLKRRPQDIELLDSPAPDTEVSLQVRAVLGGLPAETRALIGLAYFEGLTYEEMAAALDIPVGTVASRLFAAKAAFRAQWGER